MFLNTEGKCHSTCTGNNCYIYPPITAFVTFTSYTYHGALGNYVIWRGATYIENKYVSKSVHFDIFLTLMIL